MNRVVSFCFSGFKHISPWSRGLLGSLAIAATPAFADTAKSGAAIVASPLNVVLCIAFLGFLVVAALWLIRRVGGAQWVGSRKSMKVVGSLPLGQRERVVLIEVAGQQWLLGVTPGQISLLHRFDEPAIGVAEEGDDFSARMRQILQNSIGRQ